MSVPTLFVMPKNTLFSMGLPSAKNTFYQLPPDALIQQCNERKKRALQNRGALVTDSNHSPVNYFVPDSVTNAKIDCSDNIQPIEEKVFDRLYRKMIEHLGVKEIWIRDSYYAEAASRLYIRSISEDPAGDLFVYNMFLHPTEKDIENFNPDWYIIHTPAFFAEPETDGIGQHSFTIVNFTRKVILIGGKAYDNEIKKMIFCILSR